MRLLITGLIAGVFIGAILSNKHHSRINIERELTNVITEKKRNEVIENTINEYYKLYKNATNKPDTVVTERVYIKAKCPMPTVEGSRVDDGTITARVELDQRTIRNITELADRHARDYEKCAVMVNTFQAVIKNQ